MSRVRVHWHNDCISEGRDHDDVESVPAARTMILQRATGVMGWHVEESATGNTVRFSEGIQLLATVAVYANGTGEPELSRAQNEVAALLGEELAEAGQCAAKLIRFGVGVNPWTGVWNSAALAGELGDVLAAMALAEKHGLLDLGEVSAARDRKLRALQVEGDRLRYASARGLK